jgi:hypothetical protein
VLADHSYCVVVIDLFFLGYQLWRDRVNELGGINIQNATLAANVTVCLCALHPFISCLFVVFTYLWCACSDFDFSVIVF